MFKLLKNFLAWHKAHKVAKIPLFKPLPFVCKWCGLSEKWHIKHFQQEFEPEWYPVDYDTYVKHMHGLMNKALNISNAKLSSFCDWINS